MRKYPKRRLFWMGMILTGVLLCGAPVCAEEASGEASGEAETTTSSQPEREGVWDDPTNNAYGYYSIMGNTTATLEQMTDQFCSQKLEYPKEVLEKGGAPDIESFCEILLEEAQAEGVRGEVVYEQVILETGWLQFQGVCSPEQFNFAGLGATGPEEEGLCFPDVRTGLRAQVQHLKAYASAEALVGECVDERFELVQRECAPYVEWLGIQENPYGGGWAAGEGYGYKLRELLAELKGETYTWPQENEKDPKKNNNFE